MSFERRIKDTGKTSMQMFSKSVILRNILRPVPRTAGEAGQEENED